MENASPFSPTNPHFFQPLLPGFQTNLNIPVKFFSKHIKGKHEDKVVNLISDSSKITWRVNTEGHRLTNGWKEFVKAHDLRIGDFVICRHEGDFLFHVTVLGPSCCQIQYAPLSHIHEEDEKSDEIGEVARKEDFETESDQLSSDETCFSQYVTAANLLRGSVGVPIDFARRNGLDIGRHKIVLMNEEGKSWESEVKTRMSGQVYISQSWKSFCTANKLKVGHSYTFKLLRNMETPVLQLCSRVKAKQKKKIQSEEDNSVDKTEKSRFVKITITPNSIKLGKQHLPVGFTRANKLKKPGNIILVDKDKVEWPMNLKVDIKTNNMYIMGGNDWKSFCVANDLVAGESLTLELIKGSNNLLLKFCSKMEQPLFETDARAHKRARGQGFSQESRRKRDVRQKIDAEGEPSHRIQSSNYNADDTGNNDNDQDNITNLSKNQVKKKKKKKNLGAETKSFSLKQCCFVARSTYSNLGEDRLFLPRKFVMPDGLKKSSNKIVIMNDRLRTWTLSLKFRESSESFYMRTGWRSFCHDNELQPGDSVTFKLERNNTRTPLLHVSTLESNSVSRKDSSKTKRYKTGESSHHHHHHHHHHLY